MVISILLQVLALDYLLYMNFKNDERFKSNSDVDIYVVPMNTKIESLKLANKLRNMGYKVELEMIDKKLKKSLDFANKEKNTICNYIR